jgi:hypothetical protein
MNKVLYINRKLSSFLKKLIYSLFVWVILISVSTVGASAHTGIQTNKELTLENDKIKLSFNENGTLAALGNKLTGETYQIHGDEFSIATENYRFYLSDTRLSSLELNDESFEVHYGLAGFTIEVKYTLKGEDNFAEKQITLTTGFHYGLKDLVISQATFYAPELKIVPYHYQKNVTFFGRTQRGGFFTGVELPFDASSVNGNEVRMGYVPSLKVEANEKVECEPVYFGVYKRYPGEHEITTAPFIFPIHRYPGTPDLEVIPLQSESEAMVAMTSKILGPSRHGLIPMACGWHSEMEHYAYTDESLKGDMESLSFLADCGLNWLSSSNPWHGETEKMNSLVDDEKYEIGELPRRFLEDAKKKDIKVVMWSTLNSSHPWWGEKGKPFRPDKPEWVMIPGGAGFQRNMEVNCFANKPFFDWLVNINMQGLETGYYKSWCMESGFMSAHNGYGLAVGHVKCPSEKHDHLLLDATYACTRNMKELYKRIRQQHPEIVTFAVGPQCDMGVWTLYNTDICFTIDESTREDYLPGLESQVLNVAKGDKIRNWSRVRVHYHFYPHYLDQPLLFSIKSTWSSEKIDYIMLSAFSCSPNQLYYMPTKAGIPDEDKAEIRKWLDWGRKNEEYLKVRKDLPDWPAAGKVDGSAHIIDEKGLIFLFNPNKYPLHGVFTLNEEDIGLKEQGNFRIAQEYPKSKVSVDARYGEMTSWEVPPETAVILEIQSIDKR